MCVSLLVAYMIQKVTQANPASSQQLPGKSTGWRHACQPGLQRGTQHGLGVRLDGPVFLNAGNDGHRELL